MQKGFKKYAQGNHSGARDRSAPQGMPRELASGSRAPKQIEQKRDVLPEQKPITDEVEKRPPARWKVILKRVLVILSVGVALALAYLFLLLGEPDQDIDPKTSVQQETIQVPMAAMELDGNADLNAVAATFGKPIALLYGNLLPLQKVTLYDTAFQGAYARRATLSYAFADGSLLKVESIRPTPAAALLASASSALRIERIYGLAGQTATRMDTADALCIFAQSEEVVYAITCPLAHEGEIVALLKQSNLLDPTTAP